MIVTALKLECDAVLNQLNELGSDEAAATIQLLHRWHPANLLMVGIAGLELVKHSFNSQ